MPRSLRAISAVAVLCSVAVLSSFVLHAQTMGSPERYTAAAINMNRGAAGTVETVVNRWSTYAQRDQLMSVMLNKGPEKLLDALQDMPRMGYFRTPDRIGWDIH